MEDSKDNTTINTEPMQTYINIGTPDTGTMEIDLVSYRQKNEKKKYLTIEIKEPIGEGLPIEGDSESGEIAKSYLFAIDNEEAFLLLKKFFTQLSWED